MSELPRQIVVLGLMGAGKTTVGRRLATALGRPFSDSDQWIAARYGTTVRELDERIGTERMHALEAEHLLGALAGPEPSVIGAAASTVEDPGCRAAMRDASVAAVYLRAPPERLAARFRSGPHRPDFGEDPACVLRSQFARRDPRFIEVVAAVVEVEDRPPGAIVSELLAVLGGSGEGR